VTTLQTDKARWINDLVSAGFALTPLLSNGKGAYLDNWQNTPYDPTVCPEDFPGNYGVVLTDDLLVIDVDPKNFQKGDDPYMRLRLDLGLGANEEFDTYTVLTGGLTRNGKQSKHVYFRKPANAKVCAHIPVYGKGVEVKSYGAQHVGPGSIHPETGNPYTVLCGNPSELMDAPADLLEWFRRVELPGASSSHPVEAVDQQTLTRFTAYLLSVEPAVQRQGGDEHTVFVARQGHDLGLAEEETYMLMLNVFNPRCQPPWKPDELRIKVRNAYKYAKKPLGNTHPAADLGPVPRVPDLCPKDAKTIAREEAERDAGIIWDLEWKWRYEDGKGRVGNYELISTMRNCMNQFKLPSNPPEFVNPLHELIRLNRFSAQIEFTRQAPWHPVGHILGNWTGTDTQAFRGYLSNTLNYNPKASDIIDSVYAYAYDVGYHPIRQWLMGLKWDGVHRIDRLLPYYAGSADTLYTRAVGACTIIGAVARIMDPGCKFDNMLILEGPQGAGKSTFCKILGGAYHSEVNLTMVKSKMADLADILSSTWIAEAAEMTHKTDEIHELIKQFLSCTHDKVRRAYRRDAEVLPRQSIIIGTTNFTADYLGDQTGNRRYWPVTVGVMRLSELARDRDQLFAEALYAWEAGAPTYLVNPMVREEAMIAQQARTDYEPWADLAAERIAQLIELAEDKTVRFLPTSFLLTNVLGLTVKEQNTHSQRRLHHAMTQLGWVRTRGRDAKTKMRVRGYAPINLEDL